MPLDVEDYEKITAMIDRGYARVERKLDEMRKELVTLDVQKLVNEKIDDRIAVQSKRIDDQDKRIDKLEDAPFTWLWRGGIVVGLLLSLVELLAHLRILP